MKTGAWSMGAASVALASWIVAASPAPPNESALAIGVAGRTNAHVSISSDGASVGIAWSARTKDGVADVYASMSGNRGRSFGPPVRVNRVPGEASASAEQPPRIVLSPRPSTHPAIVVLWTARSTSGTRLVSARSNDGGKTFGPAEPVPGSEATGNRGWESAVATPDGGVVAVWLDHRDVPARTPSTAAGGTHQHAAASGRSPEDGVARAQFSRIFFARLGDPASPRSIAPGVCYCCKTSIATGRDKTIVAAWRHVYAGNVRDIALVKSSDGGRTFGPPVRVSEDNWILDGCPENGPAVAIDRMNTIHVVWPTLVRNSAGEENLGLFYAVSKDGQTFTKRQRIPTEGMPAHPQIDVDADGTATVVWDEEVKGGRKVVVARGRQGGNGFQFARQLVGDRPGSSPAVVSLADAAVVAWTSGTVGDSMLRVDRYPLAR